MKLKSIDLGGLSVTRLLGGGNPVSGYSHQGSERSKEMLDYYTTENVKRYFRECENNGIDAVCLRTDEHIVRVLREYWNEGGKLKWVAQATSEMNNVIRGIDIAYNNGASAVYLNGNEAARLFKAGEEKEIFKSVEYAKKLGLPTGVAAHDPSNHLWMQNEGVGLDFHFLCLYNLSYSATLREEVDKAFRPSDRALALKAAAQLKKPCLFFKILAAGRLTIDEALSDIKTVLKPKDGFVIGIFLNDGPDLIKKNVEAISALD